MFGNPEVSRPMSQQSDRASVFSEGLQFSPDEYRTPIREPNSNRQQHLAVKASEWYQPHVLEGLYVSTLMYLRESQNWGYGKKLSSHEHVRAECGPVIGTRERELAGVIWKKCGCGGLVSRSEVETL